MMSGVGPFDPNLLNVLDGLTLPSWEGKVWRAVVGDGNPLRRSSQGGRWSPPDIDVLYCSLERATALAELEHVLKRQSVTVLKPRVAHCLAVRLTKVVDLRTETNLQRVGASIAGVLGIDFLHPQHLGGAVNRLECSGLLVPSARASGGINLVIFPNNNAANDSIKPESD